MAQTSTNVSAAKPKVGGSCYRAPLGSAIPTDAIADLAAAFISQGYLSKDGLTNSRSRTTNTEQAWGGDTVQTYDTDATDEFKFVLIESLNPEVLKTVHGPGNVTGDLATGIAVKVNASEQADSIYVFDMILRNNAIKRIVIPVGRITASGDVVYKDDSMIAYEVTVTAQSDEAGNTHYEYIKGA